MMVEIRKLSFMSIIFRKPRKNNVPPKKHESDDEDYDNYDDKPGNRNLWVHQSVINRTLFLDFEIIHVRENISGKDEI